ncbi:hypothetical protein KIS4809_4638 [Bacillus sp. ZZV12-4809]|nr:hypothetical protein KIS4809_4638 [Bacillus sp. ZZV12-4809]
MTLALSIKVNDGIVLATDSATTITQPGANGSQFLNVYENANKIFHLHKGLPIGIITWGNGGIGNASIGTVIKDFRKKIMTEIFSDQPYTLESLSMQFKDYILPLYNEAYNGIQPQSRPFTGFTISGYSHNESQPEEWRINYESGDCNVTQLSSTQRTGASWSGQPEALNRLVKGYSTGLEQVLTMCGIERAKIGEIIKVADENLQTPFVIPSMPIADVIDLAEYFIDLTTKYVKYSPGIQSVGGPVEIASITKHEGYKWIKRKLYFNKSINMEG